MPIIQVRKRNLMMKNLKKNSSNTINKIIAVNKQARVPKQFRIMTGINNTIHISKTNAKNILTILFLVFTSIHLLGQQVWPVQITGSMIPPRSLDLGVYSLERSQDLSFNVTLNDPVQASLPVQLRLTIESNNQVIYKTDPNFIGTNITLSQFQQQLLDGIALQPYLTPSALVGATNDGMGSLEIPEGFNKICLEVYGIDRNVPISRKYCVQGSFQLNQPPQLSLPACEAQMEYPETQNLIFNWTPMHIGSSNSPMPVEYQFELVRLPDGVTNANDAFETAIQVYQATTMTPSLLYSQMEPLLEVNKLYAWRVKAYSMIHPTSKLFQNEGYSQICTFMYYDEDGPTSGNSNDKPSPTGCEVFDTDYGPITDNTLEAVNIVEEDVVKMGYFDMVITQAIATGQGFSGTGLVNFPMLRSKVNVNFSGLRVNNDLRVVEVQEAQAEIDQQFKLDASEILPVTIADNIDQNYISQLDNFFSNGMGINRLVSGLDPAEPQTTNLPLGLDQEDKATVAVIGINFTPRNAYLNLVSWQENNGSFLRLAGTTIPATPFGVKSGAHLVALDGLANNDTGTEITPIFGLSYASSDDTKMDCSCLGYKDMTLEPSVTISSDIMNQLGTDEIIILKPKSTIENPEEYVGELKDIADFNLTNLPDFEFKPKKAYLDLSTSEKLSQTYPGSDYQEYTENTWRGLIIDDLEIIIPEEYDFSGNNNKIKLDNGQLFIDEQDLAFGHFSKTNLLSLEDGKMGDWAYSVDTLALKLSAGQNQGAEMSGSLRVPVVADLFSYSGALQNNGGQIVMNVSVPSQPLSMNMWNALLIPDDQNSGIDAKLIDAGSGREFFPKANFSGELSLNMSDSEVDDAIRGNKGQKKSELNTVLGLNDLSFELEGVQLIDFTLDPFVLPQDRYTLENTNLDNATLRIGGIEYSIGQIDLVFEEKTETEAEELGLRIVVLEGNNKAEFIFWGKQSSQGFAFDGIEINTVDIKCECTSMIVPPSEERWGSILDEIIESEYAVLFDQNAYSGSLNNFGISKEQEGWESTLRATLKAQLNANHVGGFPMLDNETISIPFLSKSLKVQLEGGKYEGVSTIDDPSTMTFASLSSIPSDQLPFDVTNMLDELGVKVSNLPNNSKLLLTAFETNGNQTNWSGAKMELTLLYEVYKNSEYESYLRFTKSNIPVGSSSVDFSSLYMHLQEDGVNGDNDEVIYKVGDGSASLSTGSFAYMNCTEGFKYFNVQGIYKAAFSTEAGNTTNKIIHRLSSPVNGQGAAAAQFEFTVNSETSLGHFIAPLKKSYDNTKNWNFSAAGAEQLIFRPKENFSAYIDFDDEDSHKDQPSIANINTGNVPQFMGLVFKDISVEVDGLKRANDEALTFDITDVVFDTDRGLQASLSLTDPVTRDENALLGGWQYDMSSFSFNIDKTLSNDGVQVAGNILPPILDGAPPVSNAVTFEEGWVGYEGTIDFDAAGDVYQPDATLQVASVEDKLFHSSFIPGFGLELNEDSKIGMSYNSGNGEFEASLDFSGNAGIYLSQPLIEAKYAGDKPSGLDGISFVYELFEFQELKINDGDAASNCTGGGTYKGIKTIEFGTWGILAENEGLSKAGETVAKGLQGFPLTIGTPRFNCSGTNEYRMTLPVNLNLMSDEVDSGDEEADSNTSGLNAAGELGFILGLSESGFSLEDFELGCLLVEGAFGPVEMQGGLNILRSDDANTKWGDGFKAFLEATVAGINVQAVAQFGSTNHDQTTSVGTNPNGNKYRYFFIDLEATSDKGIPLGAPPVAKLYGLGGGFRYNMNTEIGSEPVVKEPNATSAAADHGDNDNCTIDADLIGAGVSLSGTDYFPDNGVYGGYIKVIAGAVSPQVFVGDLAVGVTIKENDSKLAFEQISISGNGYFQASSVKDRADENVGQVYAKIAYTASNKTLSGEFGIKMEYPPVVGLIKIPDPSYDKEFAEGQLDINFGTGVWGFKFGSWGDPEGKIALEPKSKLQYNTALFSPPFLGDAGMQFKFYVQAGHDVDNIPPIEAVVPDWDNGGTTQKRMPDALFKGGNGIVMGAKMEMNFDKEFGPFRARLNAGLGFDLSMIKYEGVDCGNGGIGLNNWYMQGQAYAYAAAKVDMQYKLPFKSGTINIADLYAALVLQAKFPNPSYFKGQLQARYSVLGGLLKGRANVKVEFGEQCEALENASPIAGIKMVADVYPNDDASDVNIFVQPKLTTNLAIGSVLTFPNYDDDGNITGYENYRAIVDYVKVKKSGTSNYIAASFETETYGLTLKFNKWLETNTDYELEYHIIWEEDKDDNGSFFPFQQKNEDGVFVNVEESDIIKFTTGAMPDDIKGGMLANQAPGFSQRYWHKNYASPLLRFDVGDPVIADLFPESTTISGKEVRYEYVAAITEYSESDGQEANAYTIPVVSYPGSKTFKKAVQGEISIGTIYKIPTVSMQDVTVREVRYPGLNDLNLGKGRMCKLEIIRRPEQTAFSTSLEEVTGENGETITNRKVDGAQETAIAEATKILYEYHFGVSKYDNLHDKLQAASVKHQKSRVRRNDLNHPKEKSLNPSVWDSDPHKAKDEYFSFDANEGFDEFDLNRIRKNAKISYLDRYGPHTAIKTWKYEGDPIHEYMTQGINEQGGSSTVKTYLKTVLKEYSTVARESDGTYWNYNFFINPDAKAAGLTSTEISNKRVIASHNLSSNKDGSYGSPMFSNNIEYGLLFHDLRSRILLNQMRWFGHFGHHAGSAYGQSLYMNWHYNNKGYGDLYVYTTPKFDWVLPSGWNDSHIYLAGEAGYKFNYHGRIKMEFPKVNKWQEMDSEVNLAQYPKLAFTLQPDHGSNESTIPNNSPVAANTWYHIKIKNSDKCVDNSGSYKKGGNIHLWSCSTDNTGQIWRFEHLGNDEYTIINKGTGMVMEVVGGSTENKGNIQQYYYNGYENQRWKIINLNNGYYKLKNVHSGKILESIGGDTHDGNNIHQYSDAIYDNQKVSFSALGAAFNSSNSSEAEVAENASVPNFSSGGGLAFLENMNYEKVPKYTYIFRENHPIAMWNSINKVATIFKYNNKAEVRLLPNTKFPLATDGQSNLHDHWVVNESGFRRQSLYNYNDIEILMMMDDGKYMKAYGYSNVVETSDLQWIASKQQLFVEHSLPYNGIYQNIPGVIEPANYDWGGPGVAYKDNNEANVLKGYRPSEGVDIKEVDGNWVVGNTYGGEWQKYSVNIEKAGNYQVIVKYNFYQPPENKIALQLKLNDNNLGEEIELSGTSGVFKTISSTVDIDKTGIQRLTLYYPKTHVEMMKVQFIHQPPAPYAGTPIRVPSSRIEAENFDAGGEGVAYHDADSYNRGDSEYRKDEGVDISNKTEASNGKRIGWCVNEWLNYTVDVNESKKYDIFIGYGRKPGNAYAKIYSNGVLLEGNTTLPTTGSYSIIGEHKYGTFDLEKGVQTLKIEITGQMAFDYIDIRDVASTPYANMSVPGLIPAKNYDNGGEGVAYHKAKPNDVSRSGYPKFHTNSWARYTFNVSEAKPMALFLKHYNYDHEFVGSVDIDGNLFSNVAMTRAEETYVGEVTLSPGTHVLTLKGTGASNFAIITNIEFKAINPTPYNNVRPSVPCRVEFEHFAEGGEGVGYYDTDPEDKFSSNAQPGARPGAGVDIYGGTIVASGPQEWLNFPINVPANGAYQLKIKYGTNKENCKMNVSSNGRNLMDIRLPETGSWSTNTEAIETITLDEGNQTLKLMMVSGNVNLDYFEITPFINQGVALKLDGENDHVALPNSVTSAIGGGNAVTIEYWFKGTNSQSAVRFQDGNGHIVTAWGSNKWSISSDGATDNSLVLDLTVDSTNIYDGEWHHLAMTWQRNTTDGFRLYLDGIKIASRNSNNSALPNISSNGRIGSFNSYERTSGSLDEVRIWNRALPEEEIQDNMNCLRPSNSPGLVAYYNFDDKSLKNLVDNGNATASGFATSGVENWVGSFGKITETCTPVTIAPEIALIDGYLPFELADSSINKSFALGDVPLDGENIIQTIKIENKGKCCNDHLQFQ